MILKVQDTETQNLAQALGINETQAHILQLRVRVIVFESFKDKERSMAIQNSFQKIAAISSNLEEYTLALEEHVNFIGSLAENPVMKLGMMMHGHRIDEMIAHIENEIKNIIQQN